MEIRMKIRRSRLLTWAFVILGILALFPLSGNAVSGGGRAVLILADVSGSMQEISDIRVREEESTKADVLKELLLGLSGESLGSSCETDIYRVRYLPGDKVFYRLFSEDIQNREAAAQEHIRNEFNTDYHMFNRRTPLADMLRQLDEEELGKTDGSATLLLISDGRQSFHDSDKEEASPLSQIKNLKEKYGQNLVLHTVFIRQKEECEADEKGQALLKAMADAADGKHFSAKALTENKEQLSALAGLLCPKPPVAASEPEPPLVVPVPEPVSEPEPVREEVKGPSDTDGDGVYDPDDKCPGTPVGATVNVKGCWILEGVRFASAKWNIRRQFHPILDGAAEVLRRNPDLHVEIQGHTDSRGSAPYNQKLSERRAGSVRDYFVRKGIAPERLSSAGYGLTIPVAPNTTADGRAMNRRVELKPMR